MNPAAGRLPIFDAGLQRNSARAQQHGANRYWNFASLSQRT